MLDLNLGVLRAKQLVVRPVVARDPRHFRGQCAGPDMDCRAPGCIYDSRRTSSCCEWKIAVLGVDLVERHHAMQNADQKADSTCWTNEFVQSHWSSLVPAPYTTKVVAILSLANGESQC